MPHRYAKHAALLEAAAEHLNDPCFGLHFASRVDLLDAGTLGYVVANSPKLGDAFRIFGPPRGTQDPVEKVTRNGVVGIESDCLFDL